MRIELSNLVTHQDALTQGLNRYFTGEPCPHGHIVERYTCNRHCVECEKIRSHKYYTKNLIKIQEAERKWRKANPDKRREQKLKQKYGITLLEFTKMLTKQGGYCAICKTDDPGSSEWHVDHDHETGKVRGLLCRSCNHLLGNAKDSFTLLELAVVYLQNKTTVL